MRKSRSMLVKLLALALVLTAFASAACLAAPGRRAQTTHYGDDAGALIDGIRR